MDKIYGVVLIGCGHIGEEHIAQIYFRENIRIVAVVDADEQKARLFAIKYGADRYGIDYHEFITRDDVDIVIIATYVSTHVSILRDCVVAGKHVLCEKPIAANAQDGQEFYRLAKNGHSHVLVAHILRRNASYIRIRELIRSGAIGRLKTVRMTQNHPALDWDRYRRRLEDCSPILDCGVHYFDVLQWFTGSSITQVMGMGAVVDADLKPGRFNYGIVTMRLADGTIGYYEAGWGRTFASGNVKQFIGDQGHITLTMQAGRGNHVEMGDLLEVYHAASDTYEQINVPAVYKDMWGQLCSLIDLIEGRPTDAPTLDEAYSAFRVALAADQAIRTNSIVQVADMPEDVGRYQSQVVPLDA